MKYCLFTLLCFLGVSLNAQEVTVNGYVYESGNRGYLNQVEVSFVSKASGQEVASVSSDQDGYFELQLLANQDYVALAKKQLFKPQSIDFSTRNIEVGKKHFLKIQMIREPGYDFEVTLAPKRDDENIPVDAVSGAWIEVYNNTTKKEVLNIKDHPKIEFDVHFDKGNHYTIMIRKEGFFTKRMEAYVNVEGCILCFEGVGSIQPGVVDNLTDGNEMGVLLANVELIPLFSGKTFEVKNIYYDFAKANLRSEAKVALKDLAAVLKDNPHVSVELGSHTDSRGENDDNYRLSQARAKSAVDYLVNKQEIPRKSIIAAGYGESDLVNECFDGVECSEEDHQKNRRTEIKVLNISNKNRIEKSLAEIRVEEVFIESVLDGNLETREEGTSPIDRPILKDQTNTQNLEVVKELSEIEENEMTEEVVEETIVRITQGNTNQKTAKQSVERELPAQSITKKRVQQAESQNVQGSVFEQRKKYNELRKRQAEEDNNKLADYSGYKIVIQFSKDPISGDHEIYQRHEDLVEYKAITGTMLYLIGDFESEEEAKEYNAKMAATIYPSAYVVQFENGSILK